MIANACIIKLTPTDSTKGMNSCLSLTGLNVVFSMATPISPTIMAVRSMAIINGSPDEIYKLKKINAPNIAISPCAKFMNSSTPNVRVSPTDIKMYTELATSDVNNISGRNSIRQGILTQEF